MQIKKPNPMVRRGLVQARVDTKEMQEIITKSILYTRGNISDYVRLACLQYRPTKKVKVKNDGRV